MTRPGFSSEAPAESNPRLVYLAGTHSDDINQLETSAHSVTGKIVLLPVNLSGDEYEQVPLSP
jgi:hypothetical protein